MEFFKSIQKSSLSPPAALFKTSNIATKGWEELRAGITTVSSHGSGNLTPTVKTEQTIRKYRSWVYPCVNLIARKVSQIPYYLYKESSKKSREEFERTLQHPLLKLLKRPNKFLSGRQFKEIIQMHLDLCGFAVAKILRRPSGQPYELHIMYPHELINIELGTDTDHIIKAFHYAPLHARHKKQTLLYEDVLYFHYPHPENPYMPYTPIQAMAHVTDLDLYLQVYEKDFFHNSARPDFVIIPDRQISEESARRVQEGWVARHRGPGKQFKPAVLSESVKFQQVGMSARDFEFVGLAQYTKDHILAAYHVPEAMLGLFQSFNKASSITAETIFVNNSIDKRLDLWEDVVNNQLLPMYPSLEGYEIEHANAKPRDDEWELAQATSKLNSGLMTLDEYRLKEGLEPYGGELCKVPWVNGTPVPGINAEADRIWKEFQSPPPMPGMDPSQIIPGQEMPQVGSNAPTAQGPMGELGGRPQLSGTPLATLVEAGLRQSRPTLASLLNASRNKRGGLAALIENNAAMHSIGSMLDSDRKDTGLSPLFVKGVRNYIERDMLRDPVDKFMFKNYEEALDDIEEIEREMVEQAEDFYVQKGIEFSEIVVKEFSNIVIKGEDGINDVASEALREEYKAEVKDFIEKGVEIGYQLGYALVQKAGGTTRQPDAYEQASLSAAGSTLNLSADLKVKATKKALTGIIRDGLEQGLDPDSVGEMIKKRFADIGHQRAMMIARTELATAAWAGQDAAYEKINRDAGRVVVQKAMLWPSFDDRDCEICDGLYEKRAVVKDYETGEQETDLPVHVNCRCGAYPIINKNNNLKV